ncbi:unnamed protein product [Rhizoctonia solani]|uniref:BTB domain-containing protein n=1 Tax=Rhizoctonia solani TaxID=456999 RepID=A0A8H3CAF3_9AGAM|nr:unnamed protein product [Rhizoctonia solani]
MGSNVPTTSTDRSGQWVIHFIEKPEESGTKSDTIGNPNGIPNTQLPEPLERHPEFFFDNTLVAIQIGKTLFNVHKYQLAKSEVFSDMFKIPKPEGDEPLEGSSPEHPIKLEGVSASDFAALLRVLYANQFSDDQLAPEASLVIPAFRLANMFNFSKLRTYLLPLAEKNLDDVDKILFAREFEIKEWLAPAHARLCKRESVLSAKEASKLGVQSVLMISRMREQHRSWTSNAVSGSYYCFGCSGFNNSTSWTNCRQCGATTTCLYCSGPGKLGPNTDMNESALEAEVKKWVEDGYAVQG